MRRQQDVSTPFVRRPRPFSPEAILRRLLLAALLAFVLVAAGVLGLICETGGRFAGSLGHPLVLLLLPGLCVGLFTQEPHTFLRSAVVDVSLAVYFAAFAVWLTAHALGRARGGSTQR